MSGISEDGDPSPLPIPRISVNSECESEVNNAKEMGMLPAFVMSVNFIIGAGFLSLPYVLYHTGIVIGVGTIFLITGMLIVSCLWTLEVCSRAQALDTVISESDMPELTFQDVSIIGRRFYGGDNYGSLKARLLPPKPRYEINSMRKFEFTELMEIFYGIPGRIISAVMIIVYLLVTLSAYSSIFGASWALNVPLSSHINNASLNGSSVIFGQCTLEDFEGLLPTGGCLNSYRLFLAVFCVITIILCMMDMNTMKPIQMTLSFILITTVVLAIGHSLYGISMGHIGNGGEQKHPSRALSWDFQSFVALVPVVMFCQVLHEGIPLLAQPARTKRKLHKLFAGVLTYTGIVYTVFSVCVALRFRDDIAATCTLNWTLTTRAGNHIVVRMISYLVVMVPSIVVCAAYPMCAITVACNTVIAITGKDYSSDPKYAIYIKLLAASMSVVSIISALFISNLKTISKFAGLIAFFLILFMPGMLQVQSRRKCRRVFGKVDQWMTESLAAQSHSLREDEQRTLSNRYNKIRDVMTMSPHYSGWWSRTWVVVVTMILSTFFFMCAGISIFWHSDTPET